MKRLHRMILRTLPGPILGWLGTLMFLLLMQFLIRYLPEIAGKGLPPGVVVELVAYNLAYMVVLAVPMSILIGSMMVFGRLSETRSYAVMKSSGISPVQLIWPTLLVGVLLTGGMTYFNNIVLPEANFRARNLWQDIRAKQPGFELEPGVFYEGLSDYGILVRDIRQRTGELHDVLIYDYSNGVQDQAIIKARYGRLRTLDGGRTAELVLEDGEVDRLIPSRSATSRERYERVAFDRHKLQLDLSGFHFERSEPASGYRSDRTMRTADMIRLVDSLEASIRSAKSRLYLLGLQAGRPAEERPSAPLQPMIPPGTDASSIPLLPTASPPGDANTGTETTAGADRAGAETVGERVQRLNVALQEARSNRALVDDARRTVEWESQRADRYRVEIHKKYSIAVACFIFALIGAPLGLSIRRGGLGRVGALSTGIFLFYWVTLVQGEKLADRGFLVPWVGMWAANLVMLTLGLWLMLNITLDLHATTPLRRRLWSGLSRKPNP